jgi:hypothetical protein
MLSSKRYCACFRYVIPVIFFILATGLARMGHAQVARMEVIPFQSMEVSVPVNHVDGPGILGRPRRWHTSDNSW